jgi:hypothetical protein
MSADLNKALMPLWTKLELGKYGTQKSKEYVPAPGELPLGDESLKAKPAKRRRTSVFDDDEANINVTQAGGAA